MPSQLLYLRDLPKFEQLRNAATRYPDVDPESIAAYLLLLRVASDVASVIHEYLESHSISPGRFSILGLLNRDPSKGLCPADLAEKAGVTRATMTGLLDGLESDGYIEREGHLADRRMLTVRLTPAGNAFLEKVIPGYLKRLNALLSPLDPPQRRNLAELLAKLGGHAASMHKLPDA
jgi:DNA-binding MarR family transcriptional regulator